MGCIINKINNISFLNECRASIGGIKKLLICNFSSDIYSKLTIINNIVTNIDSSVVFRELEFNKYNSKYTDTYNYTLEKFEYNIQIELNRISPDKREYINTLIKGSFVFIIQLQNGEYIILGEKSGIKSNNFTSTTDTFTNKSNYLFNYYFKNDYLPFEVDSTLVSNLLNRICTDLNGEFALGSSLYWNPYRDCLIGDLVDFVNP